MNNQKSPRDIIYRLNIPGTNSYTTESEEMAEIAKSYHEIIQSADNNLHTEENKAAARKRALAGIPEEQKLGAPPERMEGYQHTSTELCAKYETQKVYPVR
jgi:hypothetical protein